MPHRIYYWDPGELQAQMLAATRAELDRCSKPLVLRVDEHRRERARGDLFHRAPPALCRLHPLPGLPPDHLRGAAVGVPRRPDCMNRPRFRTRRSESWGERQLGHLLFLKFPL